MNRAWIVCAALATGTHALLLFAIHPGTPAQPFPLADEPSAVELSIVEAAPAAPFSVPIVPEPPPELSTPPPPEPTPPPELIPEPVRDPSPDPRPEPRIPKPTPAPRSRSETPKPRTSAPQRAASTPAPASTSAPPSGGSVLSAPTGPATGRGPSTSARPRYRSNPRPVYPPESRRARQQGVVLITVQVTADGRAASVQLARSSGFPLLDTAALQAVRRWTFEPARMAGITTTSRVEVPVRFDLSRP